MIPINLNAHDRAWATEVGQQRWASSQRRRSKARFAGAKEIDHIDGAGGELAFCRALGLNWPATVDTWKTVPDVPPFWEIRTLRRMPGVKVVPEDDDNAMVAWVRGQLPRYEVMGYMVAGGAKQHPEWLRDPGGKGRAIYLVPESRMVPIDPDFHLIHHYMQDFFGGWFCAYCGADPRDA